jgi:hypothetical protein
MEGAAVAADVTRSEQGTATVEGGGASRAETKAEEAVINPQLVGSIRGGLGLQQGAVAAPPGTATMDDAEKKRLKNKLKREKQKAKKKAAATAQGGASEAAPEPNAAGASADVQLTDAARKKQEANQLVRTSAGCTRRMRALTVHWLPWGGDHATVFAGYRCMAQGRATHRTAEGGAAANGRCKRAARCLSVQGLARHIKRMVRKSASALCRSATQGY